MAEGIIGARQKIHDLPGPALEARHPGFFESAEQKGQLAGCCSRLGPASDNLPKRAPQS